MHEGSRSGETRGEMGEVIRKRFDAFQEREVLVRLIRLAHARPTISVPRWLSHSCGISDTAIVSCCFLISHQLVGWTEHSPHTFEREQSRASIGNFAVVQRLHPNTRLHEPNGR
jgi:hypothetical protein